MTLFDLIAVHCCWCWWGCRMSGRLLLGHMQCGHCDRHNLPMHHCGCWAAGGGVSSEGGQQ